MNWPAPGCRAASAFTRSRSHDAPTSAAMPRSAGVRATPPAPIAFVAPAPVAAPELAPAPAPPVAPSPVASDPAPFAALVAGDVVTPVAPTPTPAPDVSAAAGSTEPAPTAEVTPGPGPSRGAVAAGSVPQATSANAAAAPSAHVRFALRRQGATAMGASLADRVGPPPRAAPASRGAPPGSARAGPLSRSARPRGFRDPARLGAGAPDYAVLSARPGPLTWTLAVRRADRTSAPRCARVGAGPRASPPPGPPAIPLGPAPRLPRPHQARGRGGRPRGSVSAPGPLDLDVGDPAR